MRTLTDHITENDSVNHQLTITVEDEPGQGGACHRYAIRNFDAISNPGHRPPEGQTEKIVLFQNGPIKESGVNGLTHEALLAIVIDRLRSFQAGRFNCNENAVALDACEQALNALKGRTQTRIIRGVEGTHEA